MSHVAMNHCIFCGEGKEILLDKRIRENAFPDNEKIYLNDEPCDKCIEEMNKGFAIIERDLEHNQNTGAFWIMKIESAKKYIDKDFFDLCKENKCFVDVQTAIDMGLRKENK